MLRSKPHLSFWQVWNISFGFFGTQFVFALQNANVSRIIKPLDAKVENSPILLFAVSLTGLMVHPILGHMSERIWNCLVRRRPYFLTGAILVSIALISILNSPAL